MTPILDHSVMLLGHLQRHLPHCVAADLVGESPHSMELLGIHPGGKTFVICSQRGSSFSQPLKCNRMKESGFMKVGTRLQTRKYNLFLCVFQGLSSDWYIAVNG